ncbi:MAG: LVIVD repeat-containing protein [Candidatus Heimdallarchaeaceae archaeon]
MQIKLRTIIGVLILTITVSSSVAMGVLLPLHSSNLIDQIYTDMDNYARLTESDFFPNDGNGNFSDWMYTGLNTNTSKFVDQAFFEFFNITDREGYLDYNTPIAYFFVQGELVFDIIINKTVLEYSEADDYVVYAYRKQFIFNAENSTLTGDETVLNFNYLWPYYIEHFGNGSEYGFQSYIASKLLQEELVGFNESLGYTFDELAYGVLNRTYAEEEGIIDLGIYLPHNWLSVRPAFPDLNFDSATSYQILYNALYDGHDYSLLTGEAGSTKYFIDLVRGLDFEGQYDLLVDVEQLLADIYGIDTPEEQEYAKSFAAYMSYLLGKPSLDWLYENQISYACERTAMEWVLGIEDPLMGGRRFPLVNNQTLSSSSIDWDLDIYYAEKLGKYDINDVGKIIAIANIPGYYYSQSMELFVEDNLAYVIEGGTDIKIVNMTDPLFKAIGQFGDFLYDDIGLTPSYDPIGVDGFITNLVAVDSFIYAVEGDVGLEVLNATDPSTIYELQQWNNLGNADMHDLDHAVFGTSAPYDALIIANGQYGLTFARIQTPDRTIGTFVNFDGLSGEAYSVDEYNNYAFVGLGTDGIDVVSVSDIDGSMALEYHYDSIDFATFNNILDVKVENGFLYVLDEVEGLLIFDIEFDGALTEQGQFAFGPSETPYMDVHVEGTNAYLAQGNYGLVVVDISNKLSPSETARFNGAEHKGLAYGVYVDGNDVYLSDYSQGLVHLNFVSNTFSITNKDQLHTFVEAWQSENNLQFNDWILSDDEFLANETYDSFGLYTFVERGYRQQWTEYFLRPYIFSSLTDTALFVDKTVYVYTAQAQIPYLQNDENSLYWMHAANFINQSFQHAGRWSILYGEDFAATDFVITHSFPGTLRDEFHMQFMLVEPNTGAVIERKDRVQYNTEAISYKEAYIFLNKTTFGYEWEELTGSIYNSLPVDHIYKTWHVTYPALPGDMATLFWQEDVYKATNNFYVELRENFLDKIDSADAMRTLGAFGSMFIISAGFIVTSVVLNIMKKRKEIPI